MALFNISPSEAVLIGCCMGEYLEARQDNEYANVLYFFWKWLSPFVPNFETTTRTQITENELPFDIEWEKFGDRSIALDENDPGVFYEKSEREGIIRTKYERSKNSLLDHLCDLVDPFVVKSFNDQARFPSREEGLKTRRCEELILGEMAGLYKRWEDSECASYETGAVLVKLTSGMQTPKSPDDKDAVFKAVKRLISENAAEDYFSIGQLFGKTSATLERWKESWYIDIDPPTAHLVGAENRKESWYSDKPTGYRMGAEYRNEKRMWSDRQDQVLTSEYRANIRSLLKAGLVQESWHAAALLKGELDREKFAINPCGLDDELRAGFCLAEARAAIWFALGTLLGSLKDADGAARERDLRSLTPRPYMLTSRAFGGTDCRAYSHSRTTI